MITPEEFEHAQVVRMKIIVYGLPAPQGSKKFVGMMKSKKTHREFGALADDNAKALNPWRRAVEKAGVVAINGAPALDAPLRVRMVFTMPKPASAPKTRRSYPKTRPDLSKLVRSTEDALTDAKVWADDGRVCECTALKVYPGDPESLPMPGVRIEIEAIA